MRQNRLQDTFAILEHLVVPESKDFPALAFQIGVSGLIARAFRVLETVSLDDQLSANAKKVDDVRSKWDLPAKLESAEATIAKKAPQAQFAVGRRSAHRSSARALVRRDAEIGLHGLPIGARDALIRPFGPPSPRGRRGSCTAPPSPTRKGAVQRPFSLREKVARSAG
jgi:hypothetical protein